MEPLIRAQGALKQGHQYALTFLADTIASISGYDYGFQYVTNGIQILMKQIVLSIYSEDSSKYVGQNIVYKDTANYWVLNNSEEILTRYF